MTFKDLLWSLVWFFGLPIVLLLLMAFASPFALAILVGLDAIRLRRLPRRNVVLLVVSIAISAGAYYIMFVYWT